MSQLSSSFLFWALSLHIFIRGMISYQYIHLVFSLALLGFFSQLLLMTRRICSLPLNDIGPDKKVFPQFYILGWYSTGSDAQESDMHIHKAVSTDHS